MEFVNATAKIAREEDHHPDITIHYSKVTLELWTHAIGGLSENDFIVAAKVDALRPR
jgi:4a-hydroxytetrahydrobiopterin dehydratase